MMEGWRRRNDALAALGREVDALRQRCERLEADAERDRQAIEQARLHARAGTHAAERQAQDLRAALVALAERFEQLRREARTTGQPAAGDAREGCIALHTSSGVRRVTQT